MDLREGLGENWGAHLSLHQLHSGVRTDNHTEGVLDAPMELSAVGVPPLLTH